VARYAVVLITAPSARSAARLSRALVEERLAACVSEVPGVRSRYRWKGRVETSTERLLIAKTDRRRLRALTARVRRLHPYSVPEIIALPIVGGHAGYLRWVGESLKGK
jgi:periplasmic divalent cation tolerance protein